MGKKNKLQKFEDLKYAPNIYENFGLNEGLVRCPDGETRPMKGKWGNHFQNDHPITLELCCGGGEYTVELARRFPNRNFIGVDIKGARLWKGVTSAIKENISNAAFLRTRIEFIDTFFDKDEISEIWITFPDPFMRKGSVNRRLTCPRFLGIYQRFLIPNSTIHLKTDDPSLYEYTLETIAEVADAHMDYFDHDIYSKSLPYAELDIRTFYEQMHLAEGRKIKYVRFRMEK